MSGVLLINGSPNKNGCVGAALEEVKKTLNEEGIETEEIHVGNKDIRGCVACNKCVELGHCVFDCKWRPTSAAFAELIGRDAEQAATPLF